MNVKEYIKADGSSPYQNWFDSLDAVAAAKVTAAKARLELGHTSNIKWFGSIGEYKINWGPGYRVYLAQEGQHLIVLFGGGTKKTQQSDIQRAKDLFQEYSQRKKELDKSSMQEKSSKKKRKRR
ncbi:MAG: type II toxin-antitoxin system RelE/ParE family toxin [Thermosynechococcaceae cyanobacterium]